jgi:hypothetical protein
MTSAPSVHSTPEDLRAYAAQQEDQLTGALPEDHTWVFVTQLPLDAVGGAEPWRAFWEGALAEGEERGVFFWDTLPAAVQQRQAPPLVVALVNEATDAVAWPNVWDGQHRLGAAAISEMRSLSAVVGFPKNLLWEQVPEAWQALPEVQAHFERPSPPTSMRRRRP